MENSNLNHGNVNIETIVYNQIEVQRKLGLRPVKLLLAMEVFNALSKSVLTKKGLNYEDFALKRFAKLEIEVVKDVRDLNKHRDGGFWSSPIQVLNEARIGNVEVALANIAESDSELYALKSDDSEDQGVLKASENKSFSDHLEGTKQLGCGEGEEVAEIPSEDNI